MAPQNFLHKMLAILHSEWHTMHVGRLIVYNAGQFFVISGPDRRFIHIPKYNRKCFRDSGGPGRAVLEICPAHKRVYGRACVAKTQAPHGRLVCFAHALIRLLYNVRMCSVRLSVCMSSCVGVMRVNVNVSFYVFGEVVPKAI